MKTAGFTVVEMLTVIVIIGILAGITLVSYNGITVLGENAKTVTAVQQTESVMRRIKAETGKYPVSDGNYPVNVCIGAYTGNDCASLSNTNSVGYTEYLVSATYDALIKQFNRSTIPQPSTQTITLNNQPHRGLFVTMALQADTNAGSTVALRWFVKRTEPCGIEGSTIVYQSNDGKACSKTLN